jgi:chromosomal replication initiation ATPase DnaA
MGDVEFASEVDLVDSIVLGAMENIAREHGLTISSEAKDYLLTRLRRNLDELLTVEGGLESRREEIERNSAALMDRVFQMRMTLTQASDEVTLDNITAAVSWLCRRFPYFVPFCP